jgi:hypothetical protein
MAGSMCHDGDLLIHELPSGQTNTTHLTLEKTVKLPKLF